MKNRGLFIIFFSGLFFLQGALSPVFCQNGNWTQWRGSNRDGISQEKILKKWPETGPKELWRIKLGNGFSAISVVDDKLYTMFTDGKNEHAICLLAKDGSEVWRTQTDKNFPEEFGDGPRCTPLIDGDVVYVISAYAKLYALNIKDGSEIWSHDFISEFGAQMPKYAFSMTPIIEGDILYTDVGGKRGYSVMAFDKMTGKVVWHSQTDMPGYSSPISATINGLNHIVFLTGTKVVGLDPIDGHLYWEFPWTTNGFINAATPIFIPEDKIFISAGYGKGAALLQIDVEGKNATANLIWVAKKMKNHMATSIYLDGYIYGFDDRILKCIDAETGKMAWKNRGFGEGTLVYADGHFIVLGDKGKLALLKATPKAFEQVADGGKPLNDSCWTVPTLANGRLYLRSKTEVVCFDLKPK
ncbi:MAG: hypothetical protein B6244_00525 [Candidatus Cloacimonetes bacterium 4572_55]|nr:MAG: hypothetical protein B6244_00525 [Candidatus Cloacimonetes bacterium 4572_55]